MDRALMCKMIEENHRQWSMLDNAITYSEARALIRKMKGELVLLEKAWANDSIAPEAVESIAGKIVGKHMKLLKPLRDLIQIVRKEEL